MWLILTFQHDHFVDPSTRYLLVQGIEAAKLCNDWTLHGWTTRAVPCLCWCLVSCPKVSRTYASNIRWTCNVLDGCGWHVIDIWWHDVVCHQPVAAVFPGLCKPNPQELVSGFKISWLELMMLECTCISFSHLMENLTYPHNSWHVFQAFSYYPRAFETFWRRNPTTQIWKLHVSAHVKSQCESTAMLHFLSTMTRKKSFASTSNRRTSLDMSPGWLPSHPTLWPSIFEECWFRVRARFHTFI